MKITATITAMLVLLALTAAAQATVSIETVTVGDPGNVGELSGLSGGNGPDRICGSVSYVYRISKYEVTAGQYTAFLNAVGATDTYGLYNTGMSRTDYGSGITQSGTSGSYKYSVANDFIDRPVNYVSYWDACRFANWLHNGQPTGSQNASTTERGAYTLDGYALTNGQTIVRNANWTWAVTNEDEWYKAAYYKGGGTNEGYWLYPTGSDAAPGQDMSDASGNNANYYTAPYAYPIDSGKYTTRVGEFQDSASNYGTFDQGGNLDEWNEAVPFFNGGIAYRGVRGGSYYRYGSRLQASYRISANPTTEDAYTGFRVAQAVVPEPSSAIALLAGLASIFYTRRRRG
jgi:formylglycine-generating enzyme required for sulfatase activity